MANNFIIVILIYLITQTTIATPCVKTNNPKNFYEKYCEVEPDLPQQEPQPNFRPNINPMGPINPSQDRNLNLPTRQSNPGYELPKPFEPPHFTPKTTDNNQATTQQKNNQPTKQPQQKKQPTINWEWMN